ncbi:MAG: hypothetical protein AB7L71_02415 [Vicinamibacterales bacterium]
MTPEVAASRIAAATYVEVREWLRENDSDAPELFRWSVEDCIPASDSEILAQEVVWVILCAGRSAQSARTIESKVWAAIEAGTPVVKAFGYRAKAAAIERVWREREEYFAGYLAAAAEGPQVLLDFFRSIPFVGEVTQYQLAKNLGAPVPKPDIWLCRLAGVPDHPSTRVPVRFEACAALCGALSRATGDSVALVDSVLWLACNKGVLTVDPDAGPISFTRRANARSSIYAPHANGVDTDSPRESLNP